MPDSFPCPRCNRLLQRAGELSVLGQPVPLDFFQCAECLSEWRFDGATFEIAFTFAVDPAGRTLDAAAFEPLPAPNHS